MNYIISSNLVSRHQRVFLTEKYDYIVHTRLHLLNALFPRTRLHLLTASIRIPGYPESSLWANVIQGTIVCERIHL